MTLVAKLEMGSFQAVKKVMLISLDKCGRPLILPKTSGSQGTPHLLKFSLEIPEHRFLETRSLKPLLIDNFRVSLHCI